MSESAIVDFQLAEVASSCGTVFAIMLLIVSAALILRKRSK